VGSKALLRFYVMFCGRLPCKLYTNRLLKNSETVFLTLFLITSLLLYLPASNRIQSSAKYDTFHYRWGLILVPYGCGEVLDPIIFLIVLHSN
ncbi:MAG TPA: hypothetical protein VKA95_03725, partial [Nitrososphaeraceae archaeon]|nr:hypothetical protein [Nitrososphaeraceae archaeon]